MRYSVRSCRQYKVEGYLITGVSHERERGDGSTLTCHDNMGMLALHSKLENKVKQLLQLAVGFMHAKDRYLGTLHLVT